jgi:hypothetical protein
VAPPRSWAARGWWRGSEELEPRKKAEAMWRRKTASAAHRRMKKKGSRG